MGLNEKDQLKIVQARISQNWKTKYLCYHDENRKKENRFNYWVIL